MPTTGLQVALQKIEGAEFVKNFEEGKEVSKDPSVPSESPRITKEEWEDINTPDRPAKQSSYMNFKEAMQILTAKNSQELTDRASPI